MKPLYQTSFILLAAMAALVAAPEPASAHGRVFIGTGIYLGAPYYPRYYPYPYYSPYAYAPPPVEYAPPPAYPVAAPAPAPNPGYCREYRGPINVGGQVRQGYGTACRQPDGSWMMMN